MKTRFLLSLLAISLLGLPWPSPGANADSYAAVLTVTHSGVEIRRDQTERWLAPGYGAVMPFGPGDEVRTGAYGRALITFWDGAAMLLLPDSVFRLDALEVSGGKGTVLRGDLSGTAVHRLAATTGLDYALGSERLAVASPAQWFATWTGPDQPASIAVAEGRAAITTADGRDLTIETGEGFLDSGPGAIPLAFDPPWNAARIQGLLAGCPGLVDTVSDVPLRVRMGPGQGYVSMGGFDETQTVQIMAINASQGWYRVQFLSSFGWILRAAVETDCVDLPVLPDDTIENPAFILDASDSELEWLRPFFGDYLRNLWFYQWTSLPSS